MRRYYKWRLSGILYQLNLPPLRLLESTHQKTWYTTEQYLNHIDPASNYIITKRKKFFESIYHSSLTQNPETKLLVAS